MGVWLIANFLWFFFARKKSLNEPLLINANSLEAQCGIWIFVISLFSVFIFLTIAFLTASFNNLVFSFDTRQFPSIIMLFSIVSVLISNIISGILAKPFLGIRRIIELFNQGIYENIQVETNTNIEEIKEIELFLLASLKIKGEKFHMEESFSKSARRIIHDIKSLIVALETALNRKFIGKKSKKILINSISAIKEVSNTLLKQYVKQKLTNSKANITRPTVVAPLIVDVVAQRKHNLDEYQEIILHPLLKEEAEAKVCVNDILFKRAMLNLLNNSLESFQGKSGKVEITAKVACKFLNITVEDNGCGIPDNLLSKVFEEGFSYGKKEGTGIGLDFVADCIKTWNGEYEISSRKNYGTKFAFKLPLVAIEKQIILLDDSPAVTMSWELEASKNNVNLKAFNDIANFMQYVVNCDKDVAIYVDSNLNSDISGEEILKKLYDLGYKNIHLQTGDDFKDCKGFYWIKSVTDKHPPFLGSVLCLNQKED